MNSNVLIIALAILSVSMVAVMVPLMLRLIGDAQYRAVHRRMILALEIAYCALWIGIVADLLTLILQNGKREDLLPNLAVLATIVVFWWAFVAGFIWLQRRLILLQVRQASVRRGKERPAAIVSSSVKDGSAAASPAQAEDHEAPPVNPRSGAIARLEGYAVLALFYFLWWVAPRLPGGKLFDAAIARHQTLLIAPLIAIAAGGAVAFLGGALSMMLLDGSPMSPSETQEFYRRHPLLGGRRPNARGFSVYRTWGSTSGGQVRFEIPFSELKAALRTGAWRTDTRLKRIMITVGGALTMSLGGFAVAFVLGPIQTKVIIAAMVLYAGIRLRLALREA